MTSRREYILRQQGEIIRQDIVESIVQLGDEFTQAFAANVTVKLWNLFHLAPNMPVSATTQGNTVYLSVTMPVLHINTSWRLSEPAGAPKLLLPTFGNQTQTGDLNMTLQWTPPEDMTLRLVLFMQFEPQVLHRALANTMWLYAYDKDGNCYRLPLPNLYADCKVCTGNARPWHNSVFDAARYTVDQFRVSRWNTDLWDTTTETHQLIRYEPTVDTFKQMPVLGHWTALCRKVATAFTKYGI